MKTVSHAFGGTFFLHVSGLVASFSSLLQDTGVCPFRAFMRKTDKNVSKWGHENTFLASFLLYLKGFLSSVANHFW